MPFVIVHDTFALENIPETEKPFLSAVRLGTQGPDPFMAHGMNPFQKRKDKQTVNPFGGYMHHIPLAPTYAKMLGYARNQDDEATRSLLFAYIDGLLMHFAVDRVCHPYVFYRSGFDGKGQLSGIHTYRHGIFESILDREYGLEHKTYIRPDKAMGTLGLDDVKKISIMWRECTTYKLPENGFYDAYVDYRNVLKMLWSPLGIKRFFFTFVLGKHGKGISLTHPSKRRAKKYLSRDIQNKSKNIWRIPYSGEERNDSFDELIAQASRDYQEAHALLEKAKEGADIEAELADWTASLNHDGVRFTQINRYQSDDASWLD